MAEKTKADLEKELAAALAKISTLEKDGLDAEERIKTVIAERDKALVSLKAAESDITGLKASLEQLQRDRVSTLFQPTVDDLIPEHLIVAKMSAGLSRPQAIEAIQLQAAHDAAIADQD